MTTEQVQAVEDAVSRSIEKIVMPVLKSVADNSALILEQQRRLQRDVKELFGRVTTLEAKVERLEDDGK
jgi:hypothetical protein